MPHYYFMFSNGTSVIEDPEGAAMPDLDAARDEVDMSVRELRQRRVSGGRSWAGWMMQVTDESGAVLFKRLISKAGGQAKRRTDPA